MFHNSVDKLPFLQFGEKPPEFRTLPYFLPTFDAIHAASDSMEQNFIGTAELSVYFPPREHGVYLPVPKVRKHGIVPDFPISQRVLFLYAAPFLTILFDYRSFPDFRTFPHSQQNPPDETVRVHLGDYFHEADYDLFHPVQN
jgi:hypothetical protein